MIEPLKELEQKLARRPEVKYTRTSDELTIEPSEADGFRIRLCRDHSRWLVSFGDVFHEHFDDPADAVEFVGFGLSIERRLREVTAPFLRRAIVERRENDVWIPVFEVGVPSSPFAIGTRELTFQNRVIQ